MIKNIIFDVGKVLVEVRWQEVMRELGFDEATVELVANATVCSSTWGEYDRSKLPYEETLTKFIMNNPTVEKDANAEIIMDELQKQFIYRALYEYGIEE